MITDIQEASRVARGSQIKLSDFHTLEAMGHDVTLTVESTSHWTMPRVRMFGFSLKPAPDVTLMLLLRFVDGRFADARLMREADACLKRDCKYGMIRSKPPVNGVPDSEFIEFSVDHDGEEPGLPYRVSPPFPVWGVDRGDGRVALCEYLAAGTDKDPIDANYWAKYALVEWWSEMGGDGERGLRTLWFGWDMGANDFALV